MNSIFNSNFIFFKLQFKDPKKRFKVCDVTYKMYHEGLENQKAYYTLCQKNGKSIYVELVNHPSKGWSYFAETKREPLLCSLLDKENYFDTPEEAHKTIFKRLNSILSK